MTGCRALTEKEVETVLAAFGSLRDKTLFVLGLKSGFRISELLSLKVSDVRQYGKMKDSVKVARRFMKKKTQGRSVYLNTEAKAMLLEYIASENLLDSHFLFHSARDFNAPIGRIQAWKVLKRAFAQSEVSGPVATHSMRKTFANRVYEKLGKDLVKTQKALGHKSINSTVSYLEVNEQDINEAIEGI